MKVECFFVGKTTENYSAEGVAIYLKRLKHYLPVSLTIIQSSPVFEDKERMINKESEAILGKLNAKDFVILLDEKGKELSSVQLSDFMSKLMIKSTSKIVFIVGGAFGVSKSIRERANFVLTFSKFTFTHQMIRVFLMEQIYRAMTIMRNEGYHHE